MHEINDAIVQGGKIILSHLPFPDGQHVRVVVAETGTLPPQRLPINEVRKRLKNGVERFDDPLAPMIPENHWEMLK